jgi:hypothetical protein
MKSSPQELFIKIIDEMDKEVLARPLKPKPLHKL